MRMRRPRSATDPHPEISTYPPAAQPAQLVGPLFAASARAMLRTSLASSAYASPPTLDTVFLLPRPVLGITQLNVRLRQLTSVSDADIQWLLSAEGRGGGLALCLGFDTEFIGSQLALIQLGNADRVLLIRVPVICWSGLVPTCLVEMLTSPSILKAAAEARKDAHMVLHSLGVRISGGVCLTAAFAPLFYQKPGLFTMMRYLFPSCGLDKDKYTTRSNWFVDSLSQDQLRYAALDAFVSWAVAAGGRDLVEQAPKFNM